MKQSTSLLGEAPRCVHIGDESDIYELFCTALEAGTQFLLLSCVDRLAGDGEHAIASEMAQIDSSTARDCTELKYGIVTVKSLRR